MLKRILKKSKGQQGWGCKFKKDSQVKLQTKETDE